MPILSPLATPPPVTTEKTNNFLIPNGTFFFEVLCFLVILWVLSKYAIPRITAILDKRQELIKKQFEESEEAKQRLEAAEAEYREALAAARREGARIKEEAAADSARIVEEARARAQRQVDDMLVRAEERIATEREHAIRQLRGEVGGLAVTLAERIVGVTLENDDKQRQVVDAFLAALDQDASASASAEAGV
jgi:F-type H+-transporting ATPase subunit b